MSLFAENNTSSATNVLFVLILFGTLIAGASYINELVITCKLPKNQPGLVCCNTSHLVDNACHHRCSASDQFGNKLNLQHRNFALYASSVVWLVLSVVIVGMTGFFWHSANSLSWCSTLSSDIAGIGARVSLWVPGAIVMLIAGLGHFHAEETGVKSVNVTLLVAQIIYGWNLWTKKMTSVDQLVGAMILDCLTFITSVTFSMKECLAARQLIRVGHTVQLFSLFVLMRVMMRFRRSGAPDDSCPCFEAYWWGPFDSCNGVSQTFWLYFSLKTITLVHSTWLCYRHMDHYDAAEKSGRNDQNTNIKTITETVYDSIPATAFTKYQEWVPIAVSSIINIELTLARSHLQGAQDSSSWGQTAQILVAAVTMVCFTYGMYSMFKEKNVVRRQNALNRSSIGSMVPKFPAHRSYSWWDWIQILPKIVRDHHPFSKLPLRVTNHSRMEYESMAWKDIENNFKRWPDKSYEELGSMLIEEAKFGDIETIRDLLLENASVTMVNEDGATALHHAAEKGHEMVVKIFLEQTIDITAQDKEGRTALHLAAQTGGKDAVGLLLEKTTDTSTQDKDGKTALHLVLESDYWDEHELEEIVGLLLEKTTDTSTQDKDGKTALHLATQWGRTDIVGLLLEKTTDTSTQGKDGKTALHLAAQRGRTAIVGLLLEKTTDTSTQDKDGKTALHLILERGSKQIALLETTTDTMIQHKDGVTALYAVIINTRKLDDALIIAELVLKTDTSIVTQGNNGKTAMGLGATGLRHERILELLLEKSTDKKRSTVLHRALKLRLQKVLETFLERDDVTIQDNRGQTLLHRAACDRANGPKLIGLLLGNITHVNKQDQNGRTALHNAALSGCGETLKLLLARGADTFIQDRDGKMASCLARGNGHKTIEAFLKQEFKREEEELRETMANFKVSF